MNSNVEILVYNLGKETARHCVVLRGTCPYCNDQATFRQLSVWFQSRTEGNMLSILCEGCSSVMTFSANKQKICPAPMMKGVERLPEEIDKYYQEALRCISADSPNGAVTLFRKTIHAIGIHYGIAEKSDNKKLFEIINKLEADGHINPKIKNALIGIKDIGNDGAHINENEPNIEQALILKELIDMTLDSTILCDQSLTTIKEKHNVNKQPPK